MSQLSVFLLLFLIYSVYFVFEKAAQLTVLLVCHCRIHLPPEEAQHIPQGRMVGAVEKAQQLRVLFVLVEDPDLVVAHGCLLLVSEDLISSSGFLKHQMPTLCTDTHAGKTLIDIKIKLKANKKITPPSPDKGQTCVLLNIKDQCFLSSGFHSEFIMLEPRESKASVVGAPANRRL